MHTKYAANTKAQNTQFIHPYKIGKLEATADECFLSSFILLGWQRWSVSSPLWPRLNNLSSYWVSLMTFLSVAAVFYA